MYRANPPLVRTIALLPLAAVASEMDASCYPEYVDFSPGARPEFTIGSREAADLGGQYMLLMTVARWMCAPFALLGGWICYRWAAELWGGSAGLLALVLWVCSPSVLAYGHLITPDIGAAGLGVAAAYVLRRWLIKPSASRAVAAGLVLGSAGLTKFTWVILFALLPPLWVAYELLSPTGTCAREWLRHGCHMLIMTILAVWVLNVGYGFERSFRPLREFNFISECLGGASRNHIFNDVRVGNRFASSPIGNLLIPLPENYLLGIDLIKFEYETKYWSYLNGKWRLGGWWYYYLYAMLIKEPLGTWGLGLMSIGAVIVCGRVYGAPFREELLLLAPAVAVLALVSSQTGFNHHIRYVLPAFPFLFILISRLGRSFEFQHRKLAVLVSVVLAWSVVSSLRVVPHSLSYYNELGSGPMGGHYHLGASNTDWGQDLLYLKRWVDDHRNAAPLHVAYDQFLIDPRLAGIESTDAPVGPNSASAADRRSDNLGPQPGWFAISVNKMHNRERDFDYFLEFQPVGYAGYSMYIYHITVDEANRARQKLGMPPLRKASTESSTAPAPGR